MKKLIAPIPAEAVAADCDDDDGGYGGTAAAAVKHSLIPSLICSHSGALTVCGFFLQCPL